MSPEFERLIQIGFVTDTDVTKRKVRVKFRDTNLISDWLCVLRHDPSVTVLDVPEGAGVLIEPWMPKVNDTVLVAYLPFFNSDGFVIGGI